MVSERLIDRMVRGCPLLFALCASSLLLATLPAMARATDTPRRPNFIFFLTDDQRADALSIAGNTVLKTPNIDQLVRDGVQFTNAFVTTSLCAPSRASFLTGQWAHTHGVRTNERRSHLRPTQITVADLLREGVRGSEHQLDLNGLGVIPHRTDQTLRHPFQARRSRHHDRTIGAL